MGALSLAGRTLLRSAFNRQPENCTSSYSLIIYSCLKCKKDLLIGSSPATLYKDSRDLLLVNLHLGLAQLATASPADFRNSWIRKEFEECGSLNREKANQLPLPRPQVRREPQFLSQRFCSTTSRTTGVGSSTCFHIDTYTREITDRIGSKTSANATVGTSSLNCNFRAESAKAASKSCVPAPVDDSNVPNRKAASLPNSIESEELSSKRAAGYTRQEVWNLPNLVSLARLAAGPVIAHWITSGEVKLALAAFIVAGWSDWLDGWLARRFDQQSTIGTYLDPLADKVLICCIVTALGIQGTLPQYLAAVIVGRDFFLVGATFAVRARQLGWQRVPLSAFFRVTRGAENVQVNGVPVAAKVQPLYLSKVNTVVQLATVSGFLLDACTGEWMSPAVLNAAAVAATGTTVMSGIAYVHSYRHNSAHTTAAS